MRYGFLIWFIWMGFLSAQDFVQDNRALHLVPKSATLIESVSSELFEKTGVRFFIFLGGADQNTDTKEARLHYQQIKLKNLIPPFIAIFAYFQAKKINIISNPADLLATDFIFFERIAPFLPKEWGADMAKNNAHFSFALLNGYAYMADALSAKFHVSLDKNIKEEGANSFVKTTLYILTCSLLALFFYGYFFGARKSRGN
ncbi:hypothetical protein [Helicobacter suis]|uniref:hypothetical protein n=1 Tax=Helicobacter suis TaxID=104628 RepID=UPI001F42E929|nr:hypothetical protein [Helicobacter suis]